MEHGGLGGGDFKLPGVCPQLYAQNGVLESRELCVRRDICEYFVRIGPVLNASIDDTPEIRRKEDEKQMGGLPALRYTRAGGKP